MYFSGYAASVTMLVRGPSLERSMSHYLIEQIAALPNVEVRTGSSATAAEGEDGRLRRVRIDGPDGEETLDAGRLLRVHRRVPAHGLAGGRPRPRRARLHPRRPRRAGEPAGR